ncbi:MAG: hypothetical protein K2Y25_09335 [Pseudomonadaceae bacterium]|nr:hypothetical protein [Pseudomonadaceae bacterium]
MSYSPPSGGTVNLDLLASLDKPNGAAVNLEFAAVNASIRYVGGLDASSFGAAGIKTPRLIAAKGENHSAFTQPVIFKDIPIIRPAGIDSTIQVGAPVASWRRFLYPEPISAPTPLNSVQRVRLVGGYNSPPGSTIVFDWGSDSYIAPPGSSVVLEFGALGSGNILSASVGNTAAYGTLYIGPVAGLRPAGIDSLSFGSAAMQTLTRVLGLAGLGIVPPVIPAPALVNSGRGVSPGGPSLGAYGVAVIEFLDREVKPSGLVATSYGTALLSGGVREIALSNRGLLAYSTGDASISFKERLVIPVGFMQETFTRPLIGYPRPLHGIGFDAATFGATDVHDNTQHLYGVSFSAGGAGEPFVAPHTRITLPQPIAPPQIERPIVVSMRRVVYPFSDLLDWGPYFGNFYYIDNRNKTIAAYGSLASKAGLALVENGARPITISGADMSRHGAAMIGYRIRHFPIDGFNTGFVSTWATAVNGARPLFAHGFDASGSSSYAALANNRRYLTYAGGGESQEFGYGFAAYAIRTISELQEFIIPAFPLPKIDNHQRFVFPVGRAPNNPGVPFIEEHFTIIAPRWVYLDRFGEGSIRNRNITAGGYGYDQAEFGRATSLNRNTIVAPEGLLSQAIGVHWAADTRQTIKAGGLLAFRIGTSCRVQLLQPDLPYQQTIEGAEVGGFYPVFGIAALTSNVLFPQAGDQHAKYGTPAIMSNGILPIGIFLKEEDQWGYPSLNPAQYVFARSIADVQVPAHRLDHHTIWATSDVTPQAVTNHDGKRFSPVDGGNLPFFGRIIVTNANRSVSAHTSGDSLRMSSPVVDLRVRYVRPNGLKSFRYGVPSIPTGIAIGVFGDDFAASGHCALTHYVAPNTARQIFPLGNSLALFGQVRIELFIRTIYPYGASPVVIYGPSRVGPTPRIEPDGIDSSVYGAQWVSDRIRFVRPQGADMVVTGYSAGQFKNRMRVTHDQKPRQLYVAGFAADSAGVTSIINHARTITPINCCCSDRIGRPVVEAA